MSKLSRLAALSTFGALTLWGVPSLQIVLEARAAEKVCPPFQQKGHSESVDKVCGSGGWRGTEYNLDCDGEPLDCI